MKKVKKNTKINSSTVTQKSNPLNAAKEDDQNLFPGYPLYPASEDIYNRFKEEESINPEDLSKHKTVNEKPGMKNEKDFSEDASGNDLDVPGSEMDDEQ